MVVHVVHDGVCGMVAALRGIDLILFIEPDFVVLYFGSLVLLFYML